MIEIDGSFGEGGGQILRSALALSIITQQPFHLTKIRANRKPKPGLQPQHLASVRAAAQISSATVTGDTQGSSELTFTPQLAQPGHYHFPIGTAGATALVLHTIYLPLMLSGDQPSEIIIEGGTHVDHAPCFHFLQQTWQAYLERLGLRVHLRLKRPGFYPRGGGMIIANLQPCTQVNPLTMLDAIDHRRVDVCSAIADLPAHVADRQNRRASARLRGYEVHTATEIWEGGPSSVFLATLPDPVPTLFAGLGARGKPAEDVAEEALQPLIAHMATNAPVDPHSGDQLLLPLCFARGESAYRVSEVTQHLLTNAAIIRQFLATEIAIEGDEGSVGLVRVRNAPL